MIKKILLILFSIVTSFALSFSFKSNDIVQKHSYISNVYSNFYINYSCENKIPILTKEILYYKDFQQKKYKRPSNFKADYYIKNKCKKIGYKNAIAYNKDYSKTGKDRGHFVNNADFNWNRFLQKQTFYLSNITPQNPSLNRGLWKKIEMFSRYIIMKNKTKAIIYNGAIGFKGYIKNKVVIPKYYFKYIKLDNGKEYFFFVENKKYRKKKWNFKNIMQFNINKNTFINYINNNSNKLSINN